MPIRVDPVPDLGEYRDARQGRLSITKALYRADPARALLVAELADLVALVRADRAGVVWFDVYGYEQHVHPYAVLDLGHDRPDHSFPSAPLSAALDLSEPGLVDVGGHGPVSPRSRPLVAVSLGSDFIRSWFVVADGGTPRPRLSATEREHVQHIAGRVSAVVVDWDLDAPTGIRGMSRPTKRESTFTGYGLLKDFGDDPLPKDEEVVIGSRFVVARLVGKVVENGGVFASGLGDEIPHVHRELARSGCKPPELPAWKALLEALGAEDLGALGDATLAVARHADAAGHGWSSAQLCSWAYDLAVASRDTAAAAAAAKLMAAACAKVSDHDAARHWARVRRSLKRALEEAPGGEPSAR